MTNVLLVAAAYLIGAIPFGLLVGRFLKGVDIRQHGSGNLGATNVSRVLGFPWGFFVLLLDCAKGFLPVFFLRTLNDGSWSSDFLTVWLAAGVVFGHIFPLWLGFRGGKGVATGLGACAALVPIATAIVFGVFVLAVLLTRYVSLGSILGALTLPFSYMATDWERAMGEGTPILCGLVVLAALIVFRHRSNLVRLVHGKEDRFRFGRRARSADPAPTP